MITCGDGSQVNAGNAMDATNFLLESGPNFCGRCAQSIQRQNCTGIARNPQKEGLSFMRSATGGTPCPCGPKCWGKLMSNGMCDCRGCKDEVSSMRSASGSNNFGGLNFQCANQPFAMATGKEEMPEGDDLISEPPWWALTALGWVAGLKKTKSCICDLTNGSQVTLTDCNRLRPCDVCCTNAHGENFAGSSYDPNNTDFTQG